MVINAKRSTMGRGQSRQVLIFSLIIFLLSTVQLDTAYAATGSVIGQGLGTAVNHPNLPSSPKFSGTINVRVDGNTVAMYCDDMTLSTRAGLIYNSDGYITDPSLIYILHNYYPTTSNPTPPSSTSQKAAAVQLAIWHYTNSLDISSGGTPGPIFNAARSIIASANQATIYSLVLTPSSATNRKGSQHTVTATLLLNQNPSSGKTITFQVQGANTATGTAVTDSNGVATFTYTGSNAGVDTITATAGVDQKGGLLWVNDGGAQPLLQAVTYNPSTTAQKTWVETICLSGHKQDDEGNPIEGWKITVTDSADQTREAYTNANGYWEVCDLQDGDYTVCEEQRSGWIQTSPEQCHDVTVAGSSINDLNFINARISCLSGYKRDDNGNPLEGWTVTVTGNGQSWTDATDSSGFWQVCNLRDGDYTVCEVQQDGWVKISPQDCHIVTLDGEDITDLDFVNARVSCLSGYKRDDEGNPLEGWTITVAGNDQTWQATTDADGFWQVCDLRDGDYRVCEVLQDGWVKISPQDCHTVILDGEDITGLDFVNARISCLSGYKRDDEGNPLQGWTVTVTGNGETWQATTDASGFWQVCDLRDGDYTVCEEQRAGWVKISPQDCHTVTLDGEDITGLDFINQKSVCISGHKFDDENNPLAGWTISVTGNDQTMQATTDANGLWQVCNLLAGTYTACEEDRNGWIKISPENCHTVTVGTTDITDLDFVNAGVSCLSGHKRDDKNNPLEGWTISVTGNDQTWQATTDANGFWQVCDLRDGDYRVCEVLQDGWVKISPQDCHTVTLDGEDITGLDFVNARISCLSGYKRDDEGNPLQGWTVTVTGNGETWQATTDADGFWQVCDLRDGDYTVCEEQRAGWVKISPQDCHTVTLNGIDITNLNFINAQTHCLSGYKRDETGLGLPDWTVRVSDSTGNVREAITDANGFWQVCDLIEGDYTVCEVQKTGWVKVSPADCHSVTLADEDRTGLDFVNRESLASCISGYKRDDKGTAISDWKITATANGQSWDATTDVNGFWQICDLPEGTYTVCEEDKPGWVRVSPEDCHTVTLTGEDQTGIDFVNARVSCLSGQKRDENGAGLQDWTITVTGNGQSWTDTTDENGFWRVCNLIDGDYTVCEEEKAGWEQISPADCHTVTLSGTDIADIDFVNKRTGFQPELCLSGHVFDKTTGKGLEGWTVTITDSEGNTQTVTTDATGRWRICGLKDDTYTVCENPEPGWTQVSPLDPAKCYEVRPEIPEKDDLDFYNQRYSRVTKTADRSQAERGEEITYTITVCNDKPIPLKNVEVKDVFSTPVEIIEPTLGTGSEVLWLIDSIPAESCLELHVTAKVPKTESKFDMGQSVSGKGFVNVHNDYSTSKEGFGLKNCVYVKINDKETISDCAVVNIGEKLGTEIKTREHGSGSYATNEMIKYRANNSSIEIAKDLDAVYNPTTFSLPNSRAINFTTLWIEKNKAKNWLTGTSISEEYTFARSIKRNGSIMVDKNESALNIDSSIEGQAHLGFLKKSQANITDKSEPIFEMSEDYAGSFSILENIGEYGLNVQYNKSTAGHGYVSADKRISDNQRTYEHGTGSYQVEEEIDTQSRYIAKDIKVVAAPAGYIYTPLTEAGQTLKWKEGMWSKSDNSQYNSGGLTYSTSPENESEGSSSYIGQEFSSLDYLDKETIASGLNEMNTNASFSGVADLRVIIGRNAGSAGIKLGGLSAKHSDSDDIIDIDERYVGEFDINRRIRLTGISKYNTPHIYVAKEGVLREVKDEGLNKTVIDYTIQVQNDGNRALGPIYVSDIFPQDTQFINASLKPSALNSRFANWTLLHLPVGGYSTINLRLNVTENATGDLVNRVSAAAGYNGEWIVAENYHVLERGWLKCCPPRIALEKSGVAQIQQPGLVSYRLAFENPGSQVMAARLTDYLPEGMILFSSSVYPLNYQAYEDGTRAVTWTFNAVQPGEQVVVDLLVQALRDGSFTNAARLEAANVDGSGTAATEASTAVYVDGTAQSPYRSGYSHLAASRLGFQHIGGGIATLRHNWRNNRANLYYLYSTI